MFSRLEENGIAIDVPYLDKMIKKIDRKVRFLQNELRQDDVYGLWRKHHGTKANLGSREQLANILFNVMKIEYQGEYTKTGKYKMDEELLNGVDLPFVKRFLELEHLKKVKGTYLEGIRREVVDGFLHPFFNLNTVRSYRSSADSPNVQNMPIRSPKVGALIRRAFIARPGHRLVEIDYSGIEVRISACYHKDAAMLEYINDPTKDMHRDMACDVFLLKKEQVTKPIRNGAKGAFVFAQFYGDYYGNCARNLWNQSKGLKTVDDIDLRQHLKSKGIRSLGSCNAQDKPESGTFEKHIQNVEHDFWHRRFPVYYDWKVRWYDSYRATGGFQMLTGFKVEGLYKKNEVINLPVQGAAFHCLLWSLIAIQKEMDRRQMKSKVIAEIHDSALGDILDDELDLYLTMAKRIMTVDVRKAWPWIITPLAVECKVSAIGGNWHEMEEWRDRDGVWSPKA